MVWGTTERQWHLSFPGGIWEAAWSSGNPHGSGMSQCTILFHAGAGGDVEHSCHPFFHHCQHHHAYLTWFCAQSQETSCASSLEQCFLSPGWHAKTTFGSALSLMEWVQVDTSLRTKRSAYCTSVCGRSFAGDREGYLSRTFASFCTASQVGTTTNSY